MIRNIVVLLILGHFLSGCSSAPDLERSILDGTVEPASELVSIAYLKSLYSVAPVTVGRDLRIEGNVISTDRYGNFYQTVCIEDETGGISIRLEGEELFKKYRLGHTLTISCNSLTLGAYSGLLQLGERSADRVYQVDPLPAAKTTSAITPGDEWNEPLPSLLTLNTLSPRYINCLILLFDVQFVEAAENKNWCEEDTDTNRHLTDRQGNMLNVRTSRHAEFANKILPYGSGRIQGILSWFGGGYQLVVSDPAYIEMTGERF